MPDDRRVLGPSGKPIDGGYVPPPIITALSTFPWPWLYGAGLPLALAALAYLAVPDHVRPYYICGWLAICFACCLGLALEWTKQHEEATRKTFVSIRQAIRRIGVFLIILPTIVGVVIAFQRFTSKTPQAPDGAVPITLAPVPSRAPITANVQWVQGIKEGHPATDLLVLVRFRNTGPATTLSNFSIAAFVKGKFTFAEMADAESVLVKLPNHAITVPCGYGRGVLYHKNDFIYTLQNLDADKTVAKMIWLHFPDGYTGIALTTFRITFQDTAYNTYSSDLIQRGSDVTSDKCWWSPEVGTLDYGR